AAHMRLADGEVERVPRRLRRASLLPGEVLRPWLVRRRVERVRAGTDVKDDTVHLQRDGTVENRQQLLLLVPRAQPRLRRPIDVAHRCDPQAAKLARDAR